MRENYTLCGTCRDRERRSGQRTCRECHNAYVRAHRRQGREVSAEAKRKMLCRANSRQLQKRGVLVPQPCEVEGCGNPKVERHHEDYAMPMHVRWLCLKHHRLVDKGKLTLPAREKRFVSWAAFMYRPRLSTVPVDILHIDNQ